MKYSKLTIFLFASIIYLPLILLFTPLGVQSESEYKKIFKKEKTTIDFQVNDLHNSIVRTKNYLIENFRYRIEMVRIFSVMNYKIETSLYPEKVLIGKSNWLFLGNQFQNVVDKTTGKRRMSEAQILSFRTKFKKAKQRLRKRGIDFCIAIAPNKHSVYSEFLPTTISVVEPNSYEDIIAFKGLDIVDLKQSLHKKKTETDNLLYYKTDSHWTHYGAYHSYLEICSKLKINKKNLFKLEEDFFTLSPNPEGYGLANLIAIQGHANDFKQVNIEKIKEKRPLLLHKNLFSKQQATPLGKKFKLLNKVKVTVLNPSAKSKKKVLIVGDSFKRALFDFFNNTFVEVSYIHWNTNEAQDLIKTAERLKPDIVIYEVVERFLDSDNHLSRLK